MGIGGNEGGVGTGKGELFEAGAVCGGSGAGGDGADSPEVSQLGTRGVLSLGPVYEFDVPISGRAPVCVSAARRPLLP